MLCEGDHEDDHGGEHMVRPYERIKALQIGDTASRMFDFPIRITRGVLSVF